MIVSGDMENKFQIRNRKDLSIIKTIEHEFGWLLCGWSYPSQKHLILGMDNNIVEFNYEKMTFSKNMITKQRVFCFEKVNNTTFLVGEELT